MSILSFPATWDFVSGQLINDLPNPLIYYIINLSNV